MTFFRPDNTFYSTLRGKWEHSLRWYPRADITPYELAICWTVLDADPASTLQRYEKLHASCKRHFEYVLRPLQMEAVTQSS